MGSSAVEYQDIPQGFEIQQDPSEARFKKAASFTFRPDVEGGYVVDHAGPTNMGLTQKFYDSYAKQNKLPPKNVQDMDPVEIKGVIKSEFFDKAGLGQMPDALAVAMFDYTVNSGVSKAVKDLQKVLGVKQDGVVGQQTLDAIYAHPDEKVLLKGLINERESFMKKLIKDDPKTYKDYENGWRNRINNLRKSLDLSFLNPFHTPEASADEIPAEAPYADIPEGFALGQDNIPEVQPDQYEDIPKGFEVAQASAKQEPQGDDLASLLAKDAARYPRPFTKEEVDSYKAGALGALEPFLSRTTDIYKDPDTKEFLEQHPIAKAVGQTARDLALLVPIGKLTAGVVSLPFIPKLAQGVAKMASGTALGKRFFNTMEATRYVAKAVHSGATFGTLAAVKEATIETPDQNLISSAQHIAGNALWGAGLGLVTAAPNYLARVATAGTYGGVTTALSGGDPLDVALNTVLFGGFELISGKSIDRNIKLQAVQNIRRATSEYLAKGGMTPDDAVKMADTAINNSITKAGGLDNVVENNSAPFMNQLASEIQKLKPTWGLSKPKNLPNYAPFESPKPETPAPTQPQPPAQPQSNAGETMPAPFKSPADAPTSPSAEVLTAPPVDVAADAQKPAVSTPEANKGDVLKEDAASYQKPDDPSNYKTAEEYVASKGVSVFHGSGTKFDSFDDSMRGSVTGAKSAKGAIWFTDNPKVAKAYSIYAAETGPVKALLDKADAQEKIAQKSGKKSDWDKHDDLLRQAEELDTYDKATARRELADVKEAVLNKDLNMLEVNAEGKTPQELSDEGDIDSWLNEQIKNAKKQGKDGLIIRNLDDAVGLYDVPSTHYAIFDSSKIKTKSQLTAEWEAAQKNKGLIKEQDTPYGDKGKEDQYLDYLKTQRITKEYKNDKSYAQDIERQIRKREGGIAEETTGYGKPAKTFYSQLERVIETKMPRVETKVHSIDITPSMKKSVMEEGQALFEHPEQYQNVKMRYFNGEGQLVREEQLNFLKSEKEVSNGKGIPDRGREAGVAPTLNGRSLWKSPAALKFKKDGYLVMPDQKIEGPEDVAFAFQFLKDAAQEHFYIVPVKDGQALAAELITIGTYNSAQPAIYEILGLLEKTGADSVYMVHNHPNGRMEPSSDDMKFTTRAMGVLDKIKVKFNGHIIIDTDKFVFIKSGQNRGLTADVIPHKQYARTRKVEVLKKYMEWSAGKESTPQIKKADDIYEVIKGITVDPKSGIVVLLNNQMRIMNMYAMPQDKINANEIMRLSARERTSAVITVNTGMDTLTTLDLMDDLNDVGMKLLDDIEVTAPGKYTSKQERGVLEAPEPYQGKIAEEGPKDIAPEDQFDALTPEEQAQFALEMDDLRKTPEGNLFIAIKRIGGIAPHRGGKLKEEYAEIPLFLKNNKGQPLDDFISQLQQYGWNFETENELIQEINRQAANPVEKVDRASLRKIIRDAQKNKRLKGTIKEKLFGKRRKFIQTVKDSENTKPEVAKAVESRYEPISNKETMTKAQAFVAESPDEAVQMIESNIKPDAFHNAVGIELIRIAQNEGRIQDAVRLVERMAEKQTALGQAIQALSMYNRLSPEGILMAAQRSIRRAKDTLPRHKVDQFEKLARDMKNPKDVEKLAKRMGVPHMTEDLAKDLVERAKKIGSAPQWEMPSVPEAKNAIQNLIDEFYSLGVEGQNNLPPEVKNAIQFTINEFEKLGVDGENTPIAKNAIQKIFKEFESLGVDGENTPMGPGIQQFMDIGRIKAARSGLIETALMLQKIQNQIPRTIWEKISMAQTIAQLLNPKTFIRNLLGNLIFQATENLADTVGAAIDIAVALNTGKRSVYLPNVKTQVKGAIQGFKEGYEEAVLGIDLKGQTLSKFTLPKNGVFNGGVMGGLEKTLRVALGATDRAFYQSAFNQSLEQQLKASGKKEIDEDMIERAHAIGLYRTFQDENILSRQFEQLKRWFNAGGKFGLGDVVLKYPRTPANLLHRGIEYSPFGFLHTVMRIADPLIFGKEFDQERFVRQTARALTGSALLVGAGAVLAALGIISGKRSKDPDIVETRRNSGIREYQINTSALKRFIMSGMNPDQAKMQEGDTLVSYDWMQPASIGIALGANMVLDPRTNLVDKTVNFADSMLQASETLQEQPLVRGVKTFTSRRNIAEGLSEVVKDMPASFVPTILNQVRQLTDNIARNTQDPNYLAEAGKKVAMRIPGASRALPAQINTLGEARQMYQDDSNSIFNVFFNPAFVSRYRPDPVSKMVLDIWGKTGETVQFPRTAPRSVKVPDSTEPLVLDPEQYQLFASYIGKKTNVLFNMKLEDPVFMALPDTEKAKKLESYLTDIKQAAMIDVLGIRPKGTDRGTMYIIKQIKTDLEKIKANEEDGIDFQPYSDVPEGFR